MNTTVLVVRLLNTVFGTDPGSRSISGLPGEAHGYPAGPSEPVAAAGQGALFAPAAAGDVPRAGVEQQVPGGDPQAP